MSINPSAIHRYIRGLLVMCGVIAIVRGGYLRTRHRHGIETARMPGMTPTESLQGQPAAAQDTESGYRFERIVGARGMESASRTEQRAHGPLVDSDQEREKVAHCSVTFFHSSARLARSSGPA